MGQEKLIQKADGCGIPKEQAEIIEAYQVQISELERRISDLERVWIDRPLLPEYDA